jgi:ribonuclease HI
LRDIVWEVPGEIDVDFAAVIELERQLLDPRVRLDRQALDALLHEDFREFGASGRIHDRTSIIETLLSGGAVDAHASDFHTTRLGPDAVLLTYRTETPSLRTSIWVRGTDGSWRVLHHQGTSPAS